MHGKIAGVGSVESSFLFQVTRCVESFDHPDLAAIMVFLECLTTLEVREFSFGVQDRGIPGSRTFLFRQVASVLQQIGISRLTCMTYRT